MTLLELGPLKDSKEKRVTTRRTGAKNKRLNWHSMTIRARKKEEFLRLQLHFCSTFFLPSHDSFYFALFYLSLIFSWFDLFFLRFLPFQLTVIIKGEDDSQKVVTESEREQSNEHTLVQCRPFLILCYACRVTMSPCYNHTHMKYSERERERTKKSENDITKMRDIFYKEKDRDDHDQD